MALGKWKAKNGTVAQETGFASRKQQRKDAKQLKKLQKIAHHQRKKVETVIVDKMKPVESTKKKKRKRKAVETEETAQMSVDDFEEVSLSKMIKTEDDKVKRGRKGESESDSDAELSYEQYLKEVKEKTRERQMNSDLARDDDIAIHRYGKLLGMDKNKSKIPKSFCDEGLDALLEFCDADDRKELCSKEGEMDLDDGDEADSDQDDKEEENELDLSEGDDEDLEDEMLDEEEAEDEDLEEIEKEKHVTEDIYGRKVDQRTGELIKFDPKAARKKLEELDTKTGVDSESRLRIDRTVTGIINRLSEATLIKSKQQFAELWLSNSKNDVKKSLSKTVWKLMGAPYRLQDSLLSTYSLFLGLVHATVSSEISSHFVEVFLVDYVQHIEQAKQQDDKAMENRLVLLVNLINFRIIKASVILELFDKLLAAFNIDNLQLIFTLCTYAYKTMKKQCWTTFCEKIAAAQNKLQDSPLGCLPRAKFLGEQLADLKKTAPNTDFSVTEQHQKMLYGILKKEKTDVEKELGMSLEDLLLAEERGRWWIVGSAFRLPTDRLEGTLLGQNETQTGPQFPQDLLDLAQKAKMNTAIRRNVFCTIASASGEDEAFEKLLRLSLKGQQERDIIYVTIQMMLKEKHFNSYYPTLVARFCSFDKRFILTTQYAIWDRIREAGSLKTKARAHLGSFLHQLIYTEVLHITVLKVVEWATLSSATSSVLRRLFTQLQDCSLNKLKRIFLPILDGKKDSVLTEGLRLFLQINFPESPVYQKVEEWFCGLIVFP